MTDPHLAPHWSSSALVTIDMQRDFLSDSPYGVPGTTEVVPTLRRLADAFRDYRVVVATDALSRTSDQAFQELAGIGAVLLDTSTITAALA